MSRLFRGSVCGALALLFVAAALPKIFAPSAFALKVFRYRLLPDAAVNPIALLLPWLESMAGLSLLSRRWRAAGATWLTALLLAGTAAMAWARLRGLDIDCGCFTVRPGAEPINALSFLRNGALLALVFWSARGGADGT